MARVDNFMQIDVDARQVLTTRQVRSMVSPYKGEPFSRHGSTAGTPKTLSPRQPALVATVRTAVHSCAFHAPCLLAHHSE